jgi:Ca-activated chloride channel family protein
VAETGKNKEPMLEEKVYTIGELAEAAGVTPRTIRYYTAEGLLPRPDSRGQYALYGAEHLLRLRLIARLKAAYLPLGEIRARIEQLDTTQVRALLDTEQAAPAPPASESAADYIAQVLQRQTPQLLAESPARYQAGQASGTGSGFQTARAMLSANEPPAPQAPTPQLPYGFAAAAPLESQRQPPSAPKEGEGPAIEPLAASAGAPRGGLLGRLVSQRRERAAAQSDERADARWRRITLAPGVELHVREQPTPALRDRIDKLVAFARDLFES